MIVLPVLCILWAVQCNPDPGFEVGGPTKEPSDTDVVISNFEVSSYQKNKLTWQLKSEEAYIFDKKKQTYFRGINLVQYENNKKSYIKAGKGSFDEKSRTMTVEENVEVVSHNGRRLYCEYLEWNEKTGKIISNKPVKVIFSEGDIIYGKHGMVADQRLERIEFFSAEGVHLIGEQ